MKTHIYYFSGTGNSLNVARLLSTELGDSEVISIADVRGREIDPSFDRLGIVFPVYGWGLPLIVRDFLEKIRTDKYVFAVATCGGRAGDTIGQAEHILRNNGVELKYGVSLKMPGNCIMIAGAPPVEKQEEILKEAGSRVKEIAATINESDRRHVEKGSLTDRLVLSGIMYRMAAKKLKSMDWSFLVDDRCKSCGTCVKMCPVNNIVLVDGKPQWHHDCEQCMACLQWCPNEAIQIGNKTQQRKRYRNPNVNRKDLTYRD
jgi:ferredoxin